MKIPTHPECVRRRLTSPGPHETGNFDVIETDQFGKQLVTFLPNLRRFAISLCRSRDLADDLVQAACERALANTERFEPGTRFDAWLFQILRNLWIDHIRTQRTAGPQEDIEQRQDLVGASGERDVEARFTLNSVAQAITDLPDDQREIILLVCVEDLSYREAAGVLNIPIGTVMSRLARARKNLAEAVGINPGLPRSPVMKGENRNDQMRVC
ncbi:MAG: RNA polymerase sigma factor [Mesorhizobium sp.]|nr:MAG: RNA polymerase sigma factor [Mesorhizobium sp.]RWQ24928.1 MAG: RNA polymerase sigma factor [Mesorhizobium sp.]